MQFITISKYDQIRPNTFILDFSMEATDDNTRWYTIAEACEYLRVSKATLYTNMGDGRLPFYVMKGTRNRRFKKSDLDALMEPGNPTDTSSDTTTENE